MRRQISRQVFSWRHEKRAPREGGEDKCGKGRSSLSALSPEVRGEGLISLMGPIRPINPSLLTTGERAEGALSLCRFQFLLGVSRRVADGALTVLAQVGQLVQHSRQIVADRLRAEIAQRFDGRDAHLEDRIV